MARRDEAIARYNNKFQDLLKSMTIDEAYEAMVTNSTYRILCGFDEQGNANRSDRIAEVPPETEVFK